MGLFLVVWIITFLALQAQVAWAGKSDGSSDSGKNTTSKVLATSNTNTASQTTHTPSSSATSNMNSSSATSNTNSSSSSPASDSTHPSSNTTNITNIPITTSVNNTSNSLPGIASSTSTNSPSAALVSSASASSVSTPTISAHSGTNSAIIAAASLGAVLLAVLGLITIFLVLRRRRRRSLAVNLGNPYTFAVSSSPSPTHSRSWLLRTLGDNTEDHSSSTRRGPKVDPSWPETINFYHTPRTPPKAFVKDSTVGAENTVVNGTDVSLSSIRFSPKTERQMEIEERVKELEGKLTLLQRSIQAPEGRPDSRALTNLTHNMRIGKWRNQIDTLQDSMSSDWALGRTDIIPRGLYVAKSID